ncbi:MAG: acetyl-CoA carboxylase, carboxyltransferase subunit beta [Planctomycetota bacterium]|nr:acetyl-CoA carboxylase, carboxyltransferase subunit beta [Planctomycetota bacterium]
MSKDAPNSGESEVGGDGRMNRLRFRKKDMPGGLWLKCESCSGTIYRKEVVEKAYTCPACGFHFTMPGADRVRHTLDEGTWEELFPEIEAMDRLGFVDSGPYGDKIERTVQRTGQKEALIAGRGEVLGRPVILGVLDFKFLGGSMGEVVGEKIALCCDVARQEGKPLILFTASGGARMHEGMLSLMQMAKTCSALSKLNEDGGFSICVLTHPTTGGVTASFAMVCDLTLAEPGALIGFAGPRVIASTIKQELPEGFQRAEFLVEKGQVDVIVARDEMRSMLARLLDFGACRPAAKAAPGPAPAAGEAAASPAASPAAESAAAPPS